ncbi:hypothetical protein GGX14DRAFT_555481 [Mycena pura]|uniref:DUF4218 domain-containing protein n=1 Tax=Mycena pura TaxID=153505 RepID=A0AAD6YQV9_9AGAR|nr:hypothetical protein GGX14DRAFT_555481 [Mycena pura]
MHLIPENIISNLLDFWMRCCKKLDAGDEEYELDAATIDEIGRECTAAGDTTPAAFGARVPNLSTQRHYFIAESYTLWTTLLAPVLLHNRFPRPKYYNHFLDLVLVFNDCLRVSIDAEYVDNEFRNQVYKWVQDYERYYYQYDPSRLSACPLTIHALLHLPDNILNAGPMWTYWNYITERYVGYLVRSSKSCKNPYASFARRLREIAQNSLIKVKYQLSEELNLSPRREEELTGHGVAGYTGIRVLHPRAEGGLSRAISKATIDYLQNHFDVTRPQATAALPDSVVHWGKISFLNGGDKIRGAELVQHSERNGNRDASFIKFTSTVDINARRPRQPRVEQRRVAYGQLLRVLEFTPNLPAECGARRPVLLAVVLPVRKTAESRRLGFPYYQDGKFAPVEVIDVDDICMNLLGSCPFSMKLETHGPGV